MVRGVLARCLYVCLGPCQTTLAECGPGANRTCIPIHWFCNGNNDCGDDSDEDVEMCGRCSKVVQYATIFSYVH